MLRVLKTTHHLGSEEGIFLIDKIQKAKSPVRSMLSEELAQLKENGYA
jgi:hypothetical protein